MSDVDAYFSSSEPVDLMLIIGTSGTVYPAAGYMGFARKKGARIAVINPDPSAGEGLTKRDWFFCEDAAKVLPEMLRPVIGDISGVKEVKGQDVGQEGKL